eukprot:9582966-Alexandrium_andersonii.AAC.1
MQITLGDPVTLNPECALHVRPPQPACQVQVRLRVAFANVLTLAPSEVENNGKDVQVGSVQCSTRVLELQKQ